MGGISFMVVTSCKEANEVHERIEKFLSHFRNEILENISDDLIQENKISLAKHKLHMFNSMDEEVGHFWSEIIEFRYDWEYHRIEAEHLKSFTKEDVVSSFDTWLLSSEGCDNSRRCVVVQVIGGGKENVNGAANASNSNTEDTNHQQKVSEAIDLNIDTIVKEKRGTCFETW